MKTTLNTIFYFLLILLTFSCSPDEINTNEYPSTSQDIIGTGGDDQSDPDNDKDDDNE